MRHPHTLTRTDTGLLIIDLQEKFEPAIPSFDSIVENIVRLTLTFQLFKLPVLVTEQYPQGLGNTVGILKNQFALLETTEKITFSCVQCKPFAEKLALAKLKSIVVCGVESHVCVNQTVLDLLQLGYQVHVVADATGARREQDHAIALQKMNQAGAIAATTEMVLFELAERAGTESFKNIQRMVKYSLKKQPAGAAAPEQTSIADAPDESGDLPAESPTETLVESSLDTGVVDTADSDFAEAQNEKVEPAQTDDEFVLVDENSLPQGSEFDELAGLDLGDDSQEPESAESLDTLDELLAEEDDDETPVV